MFGSVSPTSLLDLRGIGDFGDVVIGDCSFSEDLFSVRVGLHVVLLARPAIRKNTRHVPSNLQVGACGGGVVDSDFGDVRIGDCPFRVCGLLACTAMIFVDVQSKLVVRRVSVVAPEPGRTLQQTFLLFLSIIKCSTMRDG